MARATRSSLQQDKSPQKQQDSKKRKRISDSADEPAQKLQRTDAPPYASTKPIHEEHAAQILHVLQMIDEQGLLDRVYEQSSSLRTLLSNSQEHTLATLRSAVHSLFPISIHPRAPTAAPAAQQQRFCDLALSLLDQASFHPVSLDVESLLPQDSPDDPKFVATANKRYALMQHLPGGDYWTSANLPLTSPPETGPADLKDLLTGHADLVAIFPGPSASSSAVPKLGDYTRSPAHAYDPRPKIVPAQRRVTCGSFLDYGPWASFAPSWVQNGREIGMKQMGEVFAQRAQRYREKLEARQRALQLQQAAEDQPTIVNEKMEPHPPPEPTEADVDALQDILAPSEINSLKAVLGSLELENAVQELLKRNRTALQRLGQLQVARLRAAGGATSSVKEGDEEWDVAHGILESLTLLASLRPRSSAHPAAPLVPPPAVLHALQLSLPRTAEGAPAWHGTLPPGPPSHAGTALRDNITVKVRPGVPAAPPAPAPAPVPAPVPATPAQGYAPYASYYAIPAQQPRAAASAGVGGQYRYNSRPPQQPLQPLQQQQGQQQYYPAANQVPYGYTASAGWYGAYGSATPSAGGGGAQAYAQTPVQAQIQTQTQTQPQTQTQTQIQSGTGTPTYGVFSGASTPVPMGKAVANTVLGKSGAGAGAGQWAYGAGTQTPPVLPAHLRTGSSFYTPS